MTQGFRPDVSLPSLYKADLAHMEGCNRLILPENGRGLSMRSLALA
jgi:hypothetical protein